MYKHLLSICVATLLALSATAQTTAHQEAMEHWNKGVKAYRAENYDEVKTEFKQIRRNDSVYHAAQTTLGEIYMLDSNYYEAIACGHNLTAEPSTYTIDGYVTIANCYSAMKKWDSSAYWYEQALKVNPYYANVYYNYGAMMMRKEDYVNAQKYFEQSLTVDPFYASAIHQLANVAYQNAEIIPAMLAELTYLQVAPSGRYASTAINRIIEIANNSATVDSILKTRTDETIHAPYKEIEKILKSNVALMDAFQNKFDPLNDKVMRQVQVVLEKLKPQSNATSYIAKNYLPIYREVWSKEYFNQMGCQVLIELKNDNIDKYIKRNKSEQERYREWLGEKLTALRAPREQTVLGKKYTLTPHKDNGDVIAYGEVANGKQVGPWRYVNMLDQSRAEGLLTNNGEKEGIWRFYYNSGALREESQYLDPGEKSYYVKYYYETGNLASLDTIIKDKVEGIHTAYYANGNPKIVANYVGGKQNGKEINYHSNGQKSYEGNWVNGKKEGQVKTYYPSGALEKVAYFENDLLQDSFLYYYENGKLEGREFYNKGKLEGDVVFYHEDGKTIRLLGNYKKGEKQDTMKTFYENGKIDDFGIYKNGKEEKYMSFYQTGNLYAEYTFENENFENERVLDGTGKVIYSKKYDGSNDFKFNTYDTLGVLTSTTLLTSRKRGEGKRTYYYSNGAKSETCDLKDNKNNGLLKKFYINGKVKEQAEYVNGEAVGEYKSYYYDGTISASGYLVDGERIGYYYDYNKLGKVESVMYYDEDGDLSGWSVYNNALGERIREERHGSGLLLEFRNFDRQGKVYAAVKIGNTLVIDTMRYSNGSLMRTVDWKNGKINGNVTWYNADAKVTSIVPYVDGKRNGMFKRYHNNGQLREEGMYKQGEQVGKWKEYFSTGQLKEECTYNDEGELIDTLKRYFYNGKPDMIKVYNKKGQQSGAQIRYDLDGNVAFAADAQSDRIITIYQGTGAARTAVSTSNAGVHSSFKTTYDNGAPAAEGSILNDALVGNFTIKSKNGNTSVSFEQDGAYLNGVYNTYYANGKLRSSTTYLYDIMHGSLKRYYENGQLQSEENYYLNDLHGPAKYYDEQGNLTKSVEYYLDGYAK